MTIPTGTGKASFKLAAMDTIDAGSAAKSMREAGLSPHEFEGIANSFIYRPRGPQSSEGWLLVNRHDLDRAFPSMLGEGFLSESQEDSYKSYTWNEGSVGTLHIKNDPTSFGAVDPAAQTDIDISVIVESAYCITGVPKPDAYTYPSYGYERDKFSEQMNASTNAWDMQLCVVHLVDKRWYNVGEHGSGSKKNECTMLQHYLPRRFLYEDESFEAADEINYGTNLTAPVDVEEPYGYASLFKSLLSELDLTYDESIDQTGADYPTLCRNISLVGLDPYRCLWELLDEISHTIIFDLIDQSSAYGNDISVVPKGSNDANTLLERNTYKNLNLLTEISNDVRPKRGNVSYSILFPLESGNHGYPLKATENSLTGHRPTYFKVDVVTVGQSTDTGMYGFTTNAGSGYSAEDYDMAVLYGAESIPYGYNTPHYGNRGNAIKGRLFVRNKKGETSKELMSGGQAHSSTAGVWGSFTEGYGGSTNHQEILDHAKELAVLRAKQDHFESKGKMIIDETYIGFLKFSATKDLSAIIWSDLGDGASTRIINRPFAEDRDSRSSSPPNFPAPPKVEHVHINEFPPSHFHDDLRQMVYPYVTGSGICKEDETFFADLQTYRSGMTGGVPPVASSPGEDVIGTVKVKNKSKIPLISCTLAGESLWGTEVEIFWNRYQEEWQCYYYPPTILAIGGMIQYVNDDNEYESTGVSTEAITSVGEIFGIKTVVGDGTEHIGYSYLGSDGGSGGHSTKTLYFRTIGGSYIRFKDNY